eukprot:6187671-Pleurochrysis_carterae.AAC.1
MQSFCAFCSSLRCARLRVAHRKVEASDEVPGEEAEDGGDEATRDVGPKHGFVHGGLGRGRAR